MVFGELVDCVPIFGSQRRAYILIGAVLTASGLLILASAAGRWLAFRADYLYVAGSLLIVLGTVIQDVVADAMSTEVVSRQDADGKSLPEDHVRSELGMVQVIGRLAFSFGVLAAAGPSARVAGWFSPETVFLIALVLPVVSVIAALRIKTSSTSGVPLTGAFLAAKSFLERSSFCSGSAGSLRARDRLRHLALRHLCHADLRYARSHAGRTAHDFADDHHHLRLPCGTSGWRRIFLVDARCAEVRYGFLRPVAPHRGNCRLCRDVWPGSSPNIPRQRHCSGL